REARHRADRDLLHSHEWKGGVAQVRGCRFLEDRASIRTPDADARGGGRHVLDVDGAVDGRLVADPRKVVHAEGGAGDDAKAVLAESSDREVALDAAAVIEHPRAG